MKIRTTSDKFLITHTLNDGETNKFVRAIVYDVDMNIVVEGIETQTMADTVFKMVCDLQQGYLYAKPMPLDEFLLFCAQNNTQDARYGRDVAGDYLPGFLADNNE